VTNPYKTRHFTDDRIHRIFVEVMSGAPSGVNVARTSLWAEIQRERGRQQRLQEKEFRAFRQAQERAQREQVRAEKAAVRKAAADLKEAKWLYLEERKAEAEEMTQALQDRVAELDGVLTAGMRTDPLVTFRSLKRQETYAPFDPGPLGEPLPSPLWERFAPDPPGGFRRRAGSARYAREEEEARAAFDDARRRHAPAEARRREQLAATRDAIDPIAQESTPSR
jgi:restriction system protein